MRGSSTLLAIALLCLCVLGHARESFKKARDGRSPLLGKRSDIVEGYIVVLHNTATLADLDDVIRVCNCKYNPGFSKFTSALTGFSVHSIADTNLDQIRLHPQVEYVEHNAEVHLSDVQSPPGSWGLDRIDQTDLPLSNSYSYANGGNGVNAYLIDSGIRYSHIDFGGRARLGADFFDGGDGQDCYGHGTHVASTIGGSIHGVAKSINLWSVRIFGCDGSASSSVLLQAMDWVIRNKRMPAIINLSLGGVGTAANDAIQSATNNGILCVVAAGNDNALACNQSPASAPSAITVAASNEADQKPDFSNYGSCVDIYAPGTNIVGASFQSDNGEVLYSGTSMATPHVTGAAALLLAVYPNSDPASVTSAILQRAAVNKITNNPAGTPNLLLNTQNIAPVILSSLVFDVNFYRAHNGDLAAFTPEAASDHWVQYGIYEGRVAISTFSVTEYKAIYGDIAPFANFDAVSHFVSYGYGEGREGRILLHPLVFNIAFYLQRNTDVAQVMGYSRYSAEHHWCDYGVAEGRQASSNFNVVQYKQIYADIAPMSNNDAVYHYVQYGFREGRRGTL